MPLYPPPGGSSVTALSQLTGPLDHVAVYDKGGAVFNVVAYGAVGDGTTDDLAAFQAALTAAGQYGEVFIPPSTSQYYLSDTLTLTANQCLNFGGYTRVKSGVTNGPAIKFNGNFIKLKGAVEIDCQSGTGSIGVQFLPTVGGNCQNCTVDFVWVRNAADCGCEMLAGTRGVYFNDVKYLRCNGCGVGLRLKTTTSPNNCNANHFGVVSVQNTTGTQCIVLDRADGNHWNYLECEANSGAWGLDVIKAFGVYIDGGWFEGNLGNIRIANNPDVVGVYITATIDSNLSSSDTKFSHTYSSNRAVVINNYQDGKSFGKYGFHDLRVGSYGTAAADQGNAANLFHVAGGVTCYRSASGGTFFFKGNESNTAFNFSNATGELADWSSTRLSSSVRHQFVKGVNLTASAQTLIADGLVTLDASASSYHRVTLGANMTGLSVTSPAAGQLLLVELVQDATGGRTWTTGSTVAYGGGVVPTPTLTAASIDSLLLYYNSSKWVCVGANPSIVPASFSNLIAGNLAANALSAASLTVGTAAGNLLSHAAATMETTGGSGDVSAWANNGSCTLASSSTAAAHGTYSLRCTQNAVASEQSVILASGSSPTGYAGVTYYGLASGILDAGSGAGAIKVDLYAFDAGGASISQFAQSSQTAMNSATWTQVSCSGVAPYGTAKVRMVVRLTGANGDVRYVDKCGVWQIDPSGTWAAPPSNPTTVSATTVSATNGSFSGQVGLNQASPNAAAQLQGDSTTQGWLPPRMTSTQRDAIGSPPEGLMVYNTTTHTIDVYNGTSWLAVTAA